MVDFKLFNRVQKIMDEKTYIWRMNEKWIKRFQIFDQESGRITIMALNLMKVTPPALYLDMIEVWFTKEFLLRKEINKE